MSMPAEDSVDPHPTRLPNLVITVDAPLAHGLRAVTVRLDDELPDGTRTAQPNLAAPVFLRALASDRGLLRVWMASFATPKAPPTWFVHVDEPTATPRATNLVAYVGPERPAGTVIAASDFPSLGIPGSAQVGAIRWYPQNGLVHQIYVAPAWRRSQLATHLIYAAVVVHHAHGWPGVLHSDGRRTELGAKLMAGMRHPQRFAPLTETLPPMDGPDADTTAH